MHHVRPPPYPSQIAKLQLNHKQSQKLDWATECQTPLKANDDQQQQHQQPPQQHSPSPGSDDSPEHPSTPPNTRRSTQKQPFSASPLLLPTTEPISRPPWGLDGRTIAEDFIKMQIRDDDPAPAAHSRASSGDTSSSAASSTAQLQINTAVGSALPSKPYTAAPGSRPRSFQEGLSEIDRKRAHLPPVKLQPVEPVQGPKTSPPREPREAVQVHRFSPETPGGGGSAQPPRYPTLQDQPPTYPSIHSHGNRPPPINVAPGVDPRSLRPDDEYLPQQRSAQFGPQGRPVLHGPPRTNPQYPLPQPIIAPNSAGYPPYGSPHMPLGPQTPQVYDLNLPGSPFRGAHQHSASDPSNPGIRDAVAMMAGLHPFGANPIPPPMLYPGAHAQFFQDYQRMPQPAQFPQTPNNSGSFPGGTGSAPPGSTGTIGGGPSGGPSANNRKLGLYKTELCRSWEEKGTCRYGPKCQFAHGEEEIRKVARHPKYKTEICRTFWVSGSCPYGKRCCFIHTELPSSGAPPAGAGGSSPPSDGAPASNGPAAAVANRARSSSTNSDPTDQPVSLLTRIAAQRNADAQANANANAANASVPAPAPTVATAAAVANVTSGSTPTEGNATPTYTLPQQRPGALRVDTSTLDAQLSMKQNKSAFPYTHTHALPKAGEHGGLISPGPVTAGPDLGRSAARFDAVAYNERYNQAQTPSAGPTPTNAQPTGSSTLRHSFNGTETLNLQTQLALSSGHSSPFGAADGSGSGSGNNAGGAGAKPAPPPASAHSRSESANSASWGPSGAGTGGGASGGSGGGFGRGLANAGSPWPGDLNIGANRLGNNNSNNNTWS